MLKKQIPGKVLADFEESNFDELVVNESGLFTCNCSCHDMRL